MKRLIVALLIAMMPMMALAEEGVDRETVEELLEVVEPLVVRVLDVREI